MEGDWDNLDTVKIEPAAETSEAPPEVVPETPGELDPELPDLEPSAEKAPAGLEKEEDAPEGMVRLPDGSFVSLDQIQKWNTAENPDKGTLRDNDEVKTLREQIAALEAKISPQQPDAPKRLSAVTQADDWMTRRAYDYLDAGYPKDKIPWDRIRQELRDAQVHELVEQGQTRDRELQELKESLELAKHEQEIERELATLVDKYPNVQGELGEQVLEMALAKAEADGETDLEKVVRNAHELVPKLVMQWANNKKFKNLRLVGNPPRGGGTPPPKKKEYSPDFEGLDDMANDLHGGR